MSLRCARPLVLVALAALQLPLAAAARALRIARKRAKSWSSETAALRRASSARRE